ncbi:MAG TPA: acyl-CoA dehydrogenase family protein [Flavobacterium sp.]|nr:acyl-CoA dehydrogenase family protein [Flavobacterium sp.]
MYNINSIREELLGVSTIPDNLIQHIHEQRWLHIWVPKQYGGLGLKLANGLKTLKELAQIDGSLGWMVTLCSGANYFARNLKPEVAKELFQNPKTCFGGSGMIGGTAEKSGDKYLISGTWRYATGAPHLTHFTLNAVVTINGKPLLNEEGKEIVRSFTVPKNQVTIIPDWKAMGMKATGTYSFQVQEVWIDENHSFIYDLFYTDLVLDKIPFRIFADLTLLVNYIGLAAHFAEEAKLLKPELDFSIFHNYLHSQEQEVYAFANETEFLLESKTEISLDKQTEISLDKQTEIHRYGEQLLKNLSEKILEIYFQLGIRASHVNEPIHQVFCDYFTVTQHANFRKNSIYSKIPLPLHSKQIPSIK